MTREEEILEYANSFKGKDMESEELKEIIRLAIIDGAKWADRHPIKFSLPSNLDEAAKEYLREYNESEFGNGGDDWDDDIVITFKAGAEWMAGQGETVEGVFKAGDAGYPDIHLEERYSIEYISDRPSGIEPGDKVVVQIRKSNTAV